MLRYPPLKKSRALTRIIVETKDRIAMAALGVSVIAIVVATSAAVFTGKQYFLNEDRDQREIAAHQPTFQYTRFNSSAADSGN